ncbi:hypothetical protein PQR63_10225 [Herbaspirillum rhizosphaerae]|uniref:Uncharacterized protein n=1 Tax=Herbaspirillum rhizosphaerae TaxID=346179 RepID=A0ABW8Z9D2_9BURK
MDAAVVDQGSANQRGIREKSAGIAFRYAFLALAATLDFNSSGFCLVKYLAQSGLVREFIRVDRQGIRNAR